MFKPQKRFLNANHFNHGIRLAGTIILLLLAACQPAPTVQPTSTVTPTPEASPTLTLTPQPTMPMYPEQPVADFYRGVDLSYVNEMDDCGALYLEDGVAQDAFALFSRHGANLVRARLWHNPDWTSYSTLEDVVKTFMRARQAGMATLLDFHYSDNWADPGKQAIPAAWKNLTEEELVQAVYDYTHDTLLQLHQQGLMPAFVQVGNETNAGMLKPVTENDWVRDARLFNAGIKAVRDAALETDTTVKVILHIAQPENANWWFENAIANGIVDFDIIGLSYYVQWSAFSVSDVGAQVNYLRQKFERDVMIVETAYPWTLDSVDETAGNVLTKGVREYAFTIAGQRQFMLDLTQALISNGAIGVIYWEPAWVSTSCSTRWGTGSHWENATFFDFKHDNELHGGIDFLSADYTLPPVLVDGILEADYGAALLSDSEGDNLDQLPHLDLLSLHARQVGQSVYLGLAIAGDIFEQPWGGFVLYFDVTADDQGADVDAGRRPIALVAPFKPEFRLEISATDRKGNISGSFAWMAWDGTQWQDLAMVGGAAIASGTPSVIELQIPLAMFGDVDLLQIAVISVGRGRAHTAGDVMGADGSTVSWDDPVTLNVFATLPLLPKEFSTVH